MRSTLLGLPAAFVLPLYNPPNRQGPSDALRLAPSAHPACAPPTPPSSHSHRLLPSSPSSLPSSSYLLLLPPQLASGCSGSKGFNGRSITASESSPLSHSFIHLWLLPIKVIEMCLEGSKEKIRWSLLSLSHSARKTRLRGYLILETLAAYSTYHSSCSHPP